jgi:exopolysaccharide biosynthesis protein
VKVLFWCFVLANLALAQDFFQVPDGLVQFSDEAITIRIPAGGDITFIPGVGWTSNANLSQPVINSEGIFVQTDVAEFLGLNTTVPVTVSGSSNSTTPAPSENTSTPLSPTPDLEPTPQTTPEDAGPPRIESVRFGGVGSIRIVFDIAGVSSNSLQSAVTQGQLAEGSFLELTLPILSLPLELPEPYKGVDVELVNTGTHTLIRLSGPKLSYRVFSLENPSRLVIDLIPLEFAHVTPETKELRPGIIYKRYAAPSSAGSSGVHVLEIAPNLGEFRVVGHHGQGLPLSQLASGAFAAINAGYFDPQNFSAIGFLKVDHGLLSFPSRNRASIAFGPATPLIDRVDADVNVRISGKLFDTQIVSEQNLSVHTQASAMVGHETKGVIVVSNGQVIENKIGPRQVPSNGFALVYEPDMRELALVNAGEQAAIEVSFQNALFASSRYAVEGGPLLVSDGQAAFNPELEQFERGNPIIDQYTQQAAIGVKADGTFLMVTADTMVAQDLVSLMLSLGAYNAMRLDSGSSTTLYIDGKVINRSTERKVVTAIVFVPHP